MLTVTIAGVDRTSLINWQSLDIEKNETREANFAKFTIESMHSGQTYEPAVNDEIIIADGSTRKFGGRIVRISKRTTSGKAGKIDVECKSYALELDRKLVAGVFEGWLLSDIIKEVINTCASSGVKALYTDAGGDHVLVPHSASLNITGSAITIAIWWNSSIGTYSFLFGKVDYSAYGIFQDDTALVFFLNTSVDYGELSTDMTDFTDGEWHRVVFTYDGANMRVYVDHVENNTPQPLTGTILSDTTDLGIGGDGFDCSSAQIDEVILEAATWDQAAVDADWNDGAGVYYTPNANTRGLWHFDDDANDSSGNDNHGTLQDDAYFHWGKVSDGIRIDGINPLEITIDRVKANYVYPTQFIQKLADTYNCTAYVDDYKNLVFVERGITYAPFSITEDKTTLIADSLQVREDLSQIRNAVLVKGGTEQFTTNSGNGETHKADGQNRVIVYGQKYIKDAIFTVEWADSPYSSWTTLNVGTYGPDDPAAFDALYDVDNRSLIFEEADKPPANRAFKLYGNYYLPVLIEKTDFASVASYGLWQHRIENSSIASRAAAKEVATAELIKYAQSTVSGSFSTYRDGLEPGQAITITIPTIGVSGQYVIQKVVTSLVDPLNTTFKYDCDIVGKEVVDSIDVLLRLLVNDTSNQRDDNDNTILDRYFGVREAVNLDEAGAGFVATAYPTGAPKFVEHAFGEMFEEAEPFGTGGVGTGPQWVAGPYFPTDALHYHFSKGGAGSATGELRESGGYNNGGYLLGKLTVANAYFEIRNKATGYFHASGFRVVPGVQYRFRCRMKSENVSGSSGGQNVQILFSKADGSNASQEFSATGASIVANKVWTQYTYNFTAGANSYWGHVEARCYGHTGAQTLLGDFYFQDFECYELDGSGNEIGGNLIVNGFFTHVPPFTAATNTSNRWINGQAAGSTTNYDRKRTPLIDAGLACQ